MIDILNKLAVKLNGSASGGNIKINDADANGVIANALYLVGFAAGAIAVVIIVVAGIMYATAAGNPEQIKRARNAILYSVIGLVVITFAFAITAFIRGSLI